MTALSKIKLKQGLHRESTQYEEEGKWYDGNHVRFRSGKPENMRGYETKVSTAFVVVLEIYLHIKVLIIKRGLSLEHPINYMHMTVI